MSGVTTFGEDERPVGRASEHRGPWTYAVRHGGLMRCCLASLDDQMAVRLQAGEGPPAEGDEAISKEYGVP